MSDCTPDTDVSYPETSAPEPAPQNRAETLNSPAGAPAIAPDLEPGTARVIDILPAVSFTFVCYLSVGIPLAILPTFVHLRLGYGTFLAGLVISTQYIATVLSRPRGGRTVDVVGPKRTVIYGMFACAASGLATLLAGLFQRHPMVCLGLILLGRLFLGLGESLVSISAIMWGIGRTGSRNMAQVISWNGVATYTGLAVGAPLGIALANLGGLAASGLAVVLPAILAVVLASRLPDLPTRVPKPIPFAHIFSRVAPFGTALALGGIGFGVLATFVTLYYASLGWNGAALALTVYGVCFIAVRLTFYRYIETHGGFRVALISFCVEIAGLLLLALVPLRLVAFLSAGLIGCGFSLIFPSLAVEAVRRIPPENRGTALGAYNVFVDFSLFVTGPVAGAIIARRGYSAAFLSVAAAVAVAFLLTLYLFTRRQPRLGAA